MYYFFLIVGVVFNVVAQILLKIGMKNFSLADSGKNIFKSIVFNWQLWLAVSAYGVGFMLYAIVLSKLDLSKAYPIASVLAIVLTVLISMMFMQESVSVAKITGILLCLVGVVVIFR